jgi:hypothetical protein
MALKGTLKDFGIADIFQLISHQSKTGVLHLNSKEQEVNIFFASGNVVRAESTTRKKHDLLGSILVRAEAITEAQLEESLEIQRRTLRRLGDILIERGYLKNADLKEFARLQTTETMYKLFHWDSGTYNFESEEVTYDKESVEPIRSENILMEGFRMVDEWPMVRKKIASYEMTFKRVNELPLIPKIITTPTAEGDEVDGAFGEAVEEKRAKGPKNIGRNELLVFKLIQYGHNVQKLIDLSRLGEFETCKALLNLINEGYIKVASVKRVAGRPLDEKPGGWAQGFSLRSLVVQLGIYLVIGGVLLICVRVSDINISSLFFDTDTRVVQDPITKELLDQVQIRRIQTSLEVYRLEVGRYPDTLDELASGNLLCDKDLRFPWRNAHFYERRDDHYQLLRPFE